MQTKWYPWLWLTRRGKWVKRYTSLRKFLSKHYKTMTEIIAALLALCGGNPSVTGGFPSQRTRNAEHWCFFGVSLNKLFEETTELLVIWDATTLIWRHCNGMTRWPLKPSICYICCIKFVNCNQEQIKCKQVQIEKKGKNKSREEIFYQMKGFFFVKISCRKCFFVNRPGAHNWLSMFCASSIRDTHRNSKELHN